MLHTPFIIQIQGNSFITFGCFYHINSKVLFCMAIIISIFLCSNTVFRCCKVIISDRLFQEDTTGILLGQILFFR